MTLSIDHKKLYRLPWNLADNPIAWLEPTEKCNLACDGCYRKNVAKHKTLQEIDNDLDVFFRLRTFDGVSIAGGDPLVHPDVVEIVRHVAQRGAKPIVNTNGHALTRELIVDLKKAGLVGFTFHVDSKQGRPDWKNKSEIQMNELRQRYADLVHSVGGIACAFNSTVYPDTIEQVPDIMDWAQRNIDRVQTVVFIIFRHADLSGGRWDYYAGARKVEVEQLVYAEKEKRRIDIKAQDVVEVIRTRHPRFRPSSYLNGTESPDTFKWLCAMRLGNKDMIFGYTTGRWMEAVQSFHHFTNGRYMSYAPPHMLAHGRAIMTFGSLIDRGVRSAARRWARSLIANPVDAGRKAWLQSILIIQPIDILEDGSQNMCDGCPDMTVHDGKLVWSCRLEEPRKYGSFIRTVPRG